jgi:ubiquinone/menaquinone biosynthesis C-methylase UbiE
MDFSREPDHILKLDQGEIPVFNSSLSENIDLQTVESFGEEWKKFSQFDEVELEVTGSQYFDIVPPEAFGANKSALDIGCGSGRWSKYISSRFKEIEAIDPSDAVIVAHKMCEKSNIRVSKASVDNIPFEDDSFDFVFSLGVLHHIPDTAEAMKKAVKKLKSNGYFLVYLYYNFENRGPFFRFLFAISTLFRRIIYRMPGKLKRLSCDLIAVLVYMPFVLFSRIIRILFPSKSFHLKVPLGYYHDKSFNIIRNDALDRFGTPLEQRFSRKEITDMMKASGLSEIMISDGMPYWHAIGRKVG